MLQDWRIDWFIQCEEAFQNKKVFYWWRIGSYITWSLLILNTFWSFVDLGYCWTRKVSKSWCGFLSWCRLLRSCIWCECNEIVWESQQLAGGVSDSGSALNLEILCKYLAADWKWHSVQSMFRLVHLTLRTFHLSCWGTR